MSDYLGIDTSNYTTSAAVFSAESESLVQSRRLLPVKTGEAGLRQSDAVFLHTKQLPEVLGGLFGVCKGTVTAIGVSTKPCNSDKSYMPCFLCGEAAAVSASLASGAAVYRTSHQTGHILAALFSAKRLDLLNAPFLALHVSGGTTDLLKCTPDDNDIISIERIGGSSDLHAGQAVDRAGIALGLDFPCGPELEKLAAECEKPEKNIRVSVKGLECSLSGLQNKCSDMLESGCGREAVARFCIDYIAVSIEKITQQAQKNEKLPVLFAGGVMSNLIIRDRLCHSVDNPVFALPAFSSDNAAGCAVFAYLKHTGRVKI